MGRLGLSLGVNRRIGRKPSGVAQMVLPSYATIATFGDSITVNVNASSTATAWVGLVSTACGATLTNKGISGTVLQNSADSGGAARASNGRDRFAADLLGANKKAAVFIAYGFNDARYTGAPTTFNVAGYTNDLREVLNGLIIGGYAAADIYVGTPYYITDAGLATGSTGFTGQTRSGFEAFVQAALAVAAEFGVKSCNLYSPTNNATYIADVNGNDNIHPTNIGHAMIADAWKTQTFVSNSRAKPATVSSEVDEQTITVTASAVTGAASYEYVLVANPNDASTNTTGIFDDVAAGDYYAKARAVFGDGSKGPWAFTSGSVTVASAAAGTVYSDNFATGTAGSNLTGRTATGAGTWAANSNNTGSSLLSGVGTLIGNTSAGSSPVMIHKVGDIAFGSGVFAEVAFSIKSTANSRSSAITLRATGDTSSFTGYFLIVNGTNVRLLRAVNGTNTTVGTYSAMAIGDHTAHVELRDGSQKVWINDVLVGDHTDAPVGVTFGEGVGTRMSSNTTVTWTDTQGPHIKSVAYGSL